MVVREAGRGGGEEEPRSNLGDKFRCQRRAEVERMSRSSYNHNFYLVKVKVAVENLHFYEVKLAINF